MSKARWIALLAVIAALTLAAPAHAGIFYYKAPARWACSGCTAIGQLHSNYANWMHVTDCGGIFNDNCNHEIWQQDRDGTRQWTRYAVGKDVWLGRDISPSRGGIPVCKSNYAGATQATYGSCYQGY